MPYLHFSASMSFPGDSRHRRIKTPCWRTTVNASSSNRAWSSTGGGGDEAAEAMVFLLTTGALVIREQKVASYPNRGVVKEWTT